MFLHTPRSLRGTLGGTAHWKLLFDYSSSSRLAARASHQSLLAIVKAAALRASEVTGSSGMVPTLTDQLEAKLRGIDAYYPGTHYACLMDADGRYLAGSFTEENILEAQPEKVCAAVALLRRAAVQFAATLDQVRCLTITAQ
eukprot:5622-Heterococcus_DN1.PRE.3